jgi:hypothetical protein
MQYKYSETAGYYGSGGWICFTYDWLGLICVWKVFGSEQEAANYCR